MNGNDIPIGGSIMICRAVCRPSHSMPDVHVLLDEGWLDTGWEDQKYQNIHMYHHVNKS